MADIAPKFVLVKSVSPHNEGRFGRAGLRFTRDWRPLQVADIADVEKGVITPEILARLEAEQQLAVKPATEVEVEKLAKELADPKDDKARIAELEAANAQLEARLMKLELAGKPADDGKGKTK